MHNKYVQHFLNEFIRFTIPKNSLSFVVTPSTISSFLAGKNKRYDYIVIIDVLERESDIYDFLEQVQIKLHPKGRIVVIYRNYLQSFIKEFLYALFPRSRSSSNWLSKDDVNTFLCLAGFETITHESLCFTTYHLPVLSYLFNRFFLHFFPFHHLSFLHYVVARKINPYTRDASVSIIVPARNEKGTIKKIFAELPLLGIRTEVLFVEGNSGDRTREEIIRCIKLYKRRMPHTFKLIDQGQESGKADAVTKGIASATGEVIMIYDADMSVKAEDLVKFYVSLISNKGDFINGSRLVYPMENNAMQFFNILGNKFFSLLYTWILGQKIKDTLCGTKVLYRRDYDLMRTKIAQFGLDDPFGDFDLLIGASLLHLKIIDFPIRYYDRQYGATNIRRFQHAWQLVVYSIVAIKRIKFRM